MEMAWPDGGFANTGQRVDGIVSSKYDLII